MDRPDLASGLVYFVTCWSCSFDVLGYKSVGNGLYLYHIAVDLYWES